MIVFGCVTPHPPVIVPEVGRGQERRTAATIKAMEQLADELAGHEPTTLVVVSPHGQCVPEAMGVATARVITGSLRSWGAGGSPYTCENDASFVAALELEAKAAGIPLKTIGGPEYELDHGVMVPLYFLSKKVEGVALVPLTFCGLPLAEHFRFGEALRRAAERSGGRVAVVASGDLSHRLLPESPAGFDPMGKVFDEQLVLALSRMDKEAVLGLDRDMVERAGECGLRSIVILLGALDGLQVKPEVLSYEGPFGVGYLVASFRVTAPRPGRKRKEKHPLARLAREAVEAYVARGKVIEPPHEASGEMKGKAGVFVCMKKSGELRGCVGTFEPTAASVAEETISNAIAAATRDSRFWPVVAAELDDLDYSVDVLSRPEPVSDVKQLDPKKYGVIVECKGLRGLLLPDLDGVDTVETQIDICRQKAGIGPDDPVKLYRFEVKRYT